MSDRLHFYLLKQYNYINESPRNWLGRIVKEYDSPIANSVPTDPTPYVAPHGVHKNVISDATAFLRSASSTTFQALLTDLLGTRNTRSNERQVEVKTKKLSR